MRALCLFVLLLCNFTCLHAQEDLSKLSYEELNNLISTAYDNQTSEDLIVYLEAGRKKSKAEFGSKDSVYANYTANLGFVYEDIGMYDKAMTLYQESKEINENLFGKRHLNYAQVLNNLAVLHQSLGNYKVAEELYLEVLSIRAEKLGKTNEDYAIVLNNLAVLYQKKDNYLEAEPLLLQVKEIWGKIYGKDHVNYAISLNNLANLYRLMENYAQAEPLFLEAIQIESKISGKDNSSYASSLGNLAGLYKRLGNYAQAEALYLESKNIQEKVLGKDHPKYILATNNLAGLYYYVGDYKKAELLHLEAKNAKIKILGKDHPSYAISLSNLASVYNSMKDFTKAETLYLEARKVLEKTIGKENLDYATNSTNLAAFYKSRGRLDTALMYCARGIEANSAQIDSGFIDWENIDKYEYYSNDQTIGIVKVLKDILYKQYQQNNDKNKLEECYKALQATMRFNEKCRHKFTSEKDKLRVMETNADFVEQGIDIALLLNKNTYIEETFSFAEMNKSALLADALKGSRARSLGDLPDTLVDQEIALQEKMSEIKKQQQQAKTPEEKEHLNKDFNILNQEINAFLKSLKNKYPKYHALKYENITAKASDVQKNLTDKTILLEYFLTDSAVYLFVISKNEIKLYPLDIKIEELKKQISNLRNALTNYTFLLKNEKDAYRRYTEAAYWFYKEMLEKGIKGKVADNLIIITDGELGHLPFEAFLVERASQAGSFKNLHYLVKDYNISYNYSATLWVESRAGSKDKNLISNGKILACAANYNPLDTSSFAMRLPHFYRLRKHLQPLPAAQQEIATLSQNFDGTFLWNDSTNERYFKEQAQYYSIIHLAMHGILDKKTPMYSSLAFTENRDSVDDNFLQAFEIAHLKLNAQLVVLSACETGYGNFEQGEGIISLARSFMYAGVPSLIVSLWQVNDHSTAEIMKSFYQNLADGMDKAAALRKAKLDYIQIANGILAHPVFWSPFIQLGDSSPIDVSKGGKNLFLWLGGVAVLLAGAFLWIKKRKAI